MRYLLFPQKKQGWRQATAASLNILLELQCSVRGRLYPRSVWSGEIYCTSRCFCLRWCSVIQFADRRYNRTFPSNYVLEKCSMMVMSKVNLRCYKLFSFRILRNDCRLTTSSVSTFLWLFILLHSADGRQLHHRGLDGARHCFAHHHP